MTDALGLVLERGQRQGLLGPGDPSAHRRHAEAFADAAETILGGPPTSCCDLGSGAGVPGLVLAARWPDAAVTLLEASARRARFLRAAVAELGLGPRVRVAEGRAEALAREPELDGAFELVCARSFAPPAVTAECAARMIQLGGVLLVAEPPEVSRSTARWPVAGLAHLGLGPPSVAHVYPLLVAIRRVGPCPAAYPRRTGVPSKRPLF